MTFSSSTARAAALRRWAFVTDRSSATRAAREGLAKKYETIVDPHSVLTDAERIQRAQRLQRSDMILLAQKRSDRK